jgi:acyl carrier protein
MEKKILEILSGLRPEFDFSQPVDFIEEGMLDSFDVLTVVNELEEAFGVTIDGMAILPENFGSLEQIANLVQNSKKK